MTSKDRVIPEIVHSYVPWDLPLSQDPSEFNPADPGELRSHSQRQRFLLIEGEGELQSEETFPLSRRIGQRVLNGTGNLEHHQRILAPHALEGKPKHSDVCTRSRGRPSTALDPVAPHLRDAVRRMEADAAEAPRYRPGVVG